MKLLNGTFKKLVFLITVTLLLTNIKNVSAQSSNDFWSAFEKCTQLTDLQSLYSPSVPLTHYVMNHGVDIPSTNGVMFNLNTQYIVEDKVAINNNQRTSFFLIHEAKFNLNQAMFDLVYYYNYTGSLDTYKVVVVNLEKQNGIWTIVSSTVN